MFYSCFCWESERRTRGAAITSPKSPIAFGPDKLDVRAVFPAFAGLCQIQLTNNQPLFVVRFLDQLAVRPGNEVFSGKVNLILPARPIAHGDKHVVLKRLGADLPFKQLKRF